MDTPSALPPISAERLQTASRLLGALREHHSGSELLRYQLDRVDLGFLLDIFDDIRARVDSSAAALLKAYETLAAAEATLDIKDRKIKQLTLALNEPTLPTGAEIVGQLRDMYKNGTGAALRNAEIGRLLQSVTPEGVVYDDLLAQDPETFRREKPSVSTNPIVAPTIVDYASAGTKIDKAMSHLNEGLPGGQKMRCATAYALLDQGTVELGDWMRARGFPV